MQGLPGNHSPDETQRLLETTLGFNEGASDLIVHSLAYDSGYKGDKTATISSVFLTQKLTEDLKQWTFELPGLTKVNRDGQSQTHFIILDAHFEGLTPLNSFESQEKHRVE